jgi:DNA-binding NarL/FixJ family response regulator
MKILIADNQALYRDGLRVNLQNILPDAQIFEAGTLSQTFDILLKNVDINLILVDLDIPELHWETAIKALLEAAPNTRVGVMLLFAKKYGYQSFECGLGTYSQRWHLFSVRVG